VKFLRAVDHSICVSDNLEYYIRIKCCRSFCPCGCYAARLVTECFQVGIEDRFLLSVIQGRWGIVIWFYCHI